MALRIIINDKYRRGIMNTGFMSEFFTHVLTGTGEYLIRSLLKNCRCKTREEAERFILENAD